MNDVQRKVAEQIGLLIIANAEQAVQIEQLQAQLQALQPAQGPQDASGSPPAGRPG